MHPPARSVVLTHPTDAATLALLAGSPTRQLTMSRLALLLDVSTGALTRIVDRLADADLVHRQPSENDDRAVFAVLTDRGGQVLSQVRTRAGGGHRG